MATLVLQTVGTLVGGPIGGALGALLGSGIDARLLAPKGRQGPRLGDLKVQSSSYGSAIPKLFGTMRVAGTIVWASDLIETRSRQGGGKGRPATTSYSYAASFAVALSARPILAIGRVWADGKLLRGSAGDWKTPVTFRLHPGGEDQAVDPLIAAAEGVETPAYRGTALAVFEALPLADYGNRIPQLSFEVIADPGPVRAGLIAEALSAGAVTGGGGALLDGYAASGDSVRGALEAIDRAAPIRIRDDGAVLRIVADSVPLTIDPAELGARSDAAAGRRIIERSAQGALPDELAIVHHDPARDHLAGQQRARRGSVGGQAELIELPAAIAAADAKVLAEQALAARWAERRRATIRLPWRRLAVRPGDRIHDPLLGEMAVRSMSIERGAIELGLSGIAGAQAGAATSPGRVTAEADLPHGPTTLVLLDLPPIDGVDPAQPMMWAAAGGGPGWRRATLMLSLDGGTGFAPAGRTAAPARIGIAETMLGTGTALMIDDIASVDIALLHDGLWLEGCDDDALIAGANAAMLGGELIQFGRAQPLGGGRFRLSRLLRGRRGTEAAIVGHGPGERFVLIEPETLTPIIVPREALGTMATVLAIGAGDLADGVTTTIRAAGRALLPPAPVHLEAQADGGDVLIGWTRRSRSGWSWVDGTDAPVGEEAERYRLTVTPAGGASRTVTTDTASWRYPAALRSEDGGDARRLTISVAMLGAFGASAEPAIRHFDLTGD
ncbi:phage tail protein [Sphingomonas sp. 1P06PA]|uniref:GTA baseplate fiber-binding domain-containing protein n=1 Tax=Sphingomonas sp. 1P06PA TaxID=554121 RepID=UPI0039A5279A